MRLLLQIGIFAATAVGVAGFFGAASPVLDAFGIFRPHIALSAAALCLLGLTLRFWREAAFSAALCGAMVWGLGPALSSPVQPLAEAPCAGGEIRVAIANLLYNNPDIEQAAADAVRIDADILVTVETTPAMMLGSPLSERYRYASVLPGEEPRGLFAVVWSNRPLMRPAAGGALRTRPIYSSAVIELGGTDVAIVGLHLAWPVLGGQRAQIEGAPQIVGDLPPQRILLGDFNHVPWSYALARIGALTGTELVKGYRLTWRGPYPYGLPAPLGHPIDHIFVSEHFRTREIETFTLTGSDHLGVVARLQLCSA